MKRKKPTTREEAFQILDELLGEEERAKLAACSKEELGAYHFGLGMWIRNNWIYNQDFDVMALFDDEPEGGTGKEDDGLLILCGHPDMESNDIIEKYWEYLQDKWQK